MGSVEILLGLSGGTVVFVTGLYEEWVHSLSAIDREALLLLRKLRFAAFWEKINGTFLFVIITGIILGLLLTGWLVNIFVQHYSTLELQF